MKKLFLSSPLVVLFVSLAFVGCDSFDAPVQASNEVTAPSDVPAGKTYDDFNNVVTGGFTVSLDTKNKLFGEPLGTYVYTLDPGNNTDGIDHFAIQYGACAGPGYSSPPSPDVNGPNTPSSTTLSGTVLQWRFPQSDKSATRTVVLNVDSAPFIGWGFFELKRGGGEILKGKVLVPCMNTRSETFSVYQDVNRNGERDEGENGIEGFTLNLRDADDADIPGDDNTTQRVATAVSDEDGVVTFTGILDPGEYTVEVPDDAANADLLDDFLAVGSTSGSTTEIESFSFDLSKILGKVFVDPQQGNETVPDDEVGIPDVTVSATLQGCDPQTDGTCTFNGRTGPDGLYVIDNLPAGTYLVSVPAVTAQFGDDFNEDLDFFFDPTFPSPSFEYTVEVGARILDETCGPLPTDLGKSCNNDFGFNADGGTINQVIDQADADGDLTTADFKHWLSLSRQMCNKGGTVIVDPQITGDTPGSYVLQELLDQINAFGYASVPQEMQGACQLKERLDRPINNFLIELEVAITVAELNYFLPGYDLCYNGNCDPLFVRTILQNAEAEYVERQKTFLAAKPESCGITCETLTNYSGGGGGGGTGFE